MKLTLTYEGPLPPTQRGVSPIKRKLREQFHPQILAQVKNRLPDHQRHLLTSTVGGYNFIAPVHRAYKTATELDVFLLIPGTARNVGDADNRVKTLVDGLTRPANEDQLQEHMEPEGDGLTYCLMDDDSLVQRISLETRRWWKPGVVPSEALAIVTATIVLDSSADLSSNFGSLLLLL